MEQFAQHPSFECFFLARMEQANACMRTAMGESATAKGEDLPSVTLAKLYVKYDPRCKEFLALHLREMHARSDQERLPTPKEVERAPLLMRSPSTFLGLMLVLGAIDVENSLRPDYEPVVASGPYAQAMYDLSVGMMEMQEGHPVVEGGAIDCVQVLHRVETYVQLSEGAACGASPAEMAAIGADEVDLRLIQEHNRMERVYLAQGNDPRCIDPLSLQQELWDAGAVGGMDAVLRPLERELGLEVGPNHDRTIVETAARQGANYAYHRDVTAPAVMPRRAAPPAPTGAPAASSEPSQSRLDAHHATMTAEHRAELDRRAEVRAAAAAAAAAKKASAFTPTGPSGPVREGVPAVKLEDTVDAAKRVTRKQMTKEQRAQERTEKKLRDEAEAAEIEAQLHALAIGDAIQSGKAKPNSPAKPKSLKK